MHVECCCSFMLLLYCCGVGGDSAVPPKLRPVAFAVVQCAQRESGRASLRRDTSSCERRATCIPRCALHPAQSFHYGMSFELMAQASFLVSRRVWLGQWHRSGVPAFTGLLLRCAPHSVNHSVRRLPQSPPTQAHNRIKVRIAFGIAYCIWHSARPDHGCHWHC